MKDIEKMSREELLEILKKIKEDIEYGEDAGDIVLSIAEFVGADTSPK